MEEGPYKHYERPRRTRRQQNYQKSSKWGSIVVCLIIVLMALVPLVLHSTNGAGQQAAVEKSHPVKHADKQAQKPQPTKRKKKATKAKKQRQAAKQQTRIKKKIATTRPKTYVVKSGDTIASIASRYKMTEAQLEEINGMANNSNINAGQTLKLR